ncbi:MAG: dTDP-4-dehydrorhamnose reductase [Alphaproteobacteria bacterium]|nr:dTDP-4-dehydrorhamnose reductase [Alphaproteobacteria bacterium]MCB9929131.1 dTDP-4-dehydrorhamnose reductase [Alphaproteobacteria bacterium]
MTRVLIFGAQGQLARALAHSPWPRGWRTRYLDRSRCDLTDFAAVRDAILEGAPALIVNAAAHTAVDRAESQPDIAWAVNALAPAAMAEAARQVGAALVQVSTDYVFSGSLGPAWTEADEPRPLNVYGATKAASEEAVRAALPRHLILRTAWLFDRSGRNFVTTMLRLGRMQDRLSVVNDQYGRPTAAGDLAQALVHMAHAAMSADSGWGTYHLTNGGPAVMRADFARSIFAAAAPWYGAPPEIVPVRSNAFPAAAQRPANAVLDTARAEQVFGLAPRPWSDALGATLAQPLPRCAAARTRSAQGASARVAA